MLYTVKVTGLPAFADVSFIGDDVLCELSQYWVGNKQTIIFTHQQQALVVKQHVLHVTITNNKKYPDALVKYICEELTVRLSML